MFAKLLIAVFALRALLANADPVPLQPGEYMRLVLVGTTSGP